MSDEPDANVSDAGGTCDSCEGSGIAIGTGEPCNECVGGASTPSESWSVGGQGQV